MTKEGEISILSFEYGTRTIEFKVEYRNRKTLEIAIKPPEEIRVLAPRSTNDEDIIRVVRSKAKWIVQKIFEFKDVEYIKRNKEYVNGESFMYLGRNYSLQIIENKNIDEPQAKLFQGKFYIESSVKDQEMLKKSMEEWYREKTLEKVLEKVEYYKHHFKIKPRNITIKNQKKRWASCNSNRDLTFNLRCVMAPSNVLDYIVVHELCHLVHLNHSKDYWKLVKTIMPDYEERKLWLKNYGIRMDL